MRPMTLNMSKMKKIASDKKTSTFKHDDGHTMIILHAALPALQRKQIEKMPLCHGGKVEKMADGGDVLPKYMHPPKDPKMVAVPRLAMAEGGETSKDEKESYADTAKRYAGYVKEGVSDMIDNPPSPLEAAQGVWDNNKASKAYAEGTTDGPVQQDDSAPQEAAMPPQNVSQQAAVPVALPASIPIPVNPAVTFAGKDSMEGVQIPTVPEGVSNTNPDGTMNPAAVMQNTQQSGKSQKDIDIAAGQAAAHRTIGYQQALAQSQQDLQNKYNEVSRHVDEAAQWLSDPKNNNPDHYRESMGAGRKVGTAIALLLGGFAPNGNPAERFLSQQIDRDIAAQDRMRDNKKTILGAYEALYGKGAAANASTKATLLDMYKNDVDRTAAKLATPQAQARALDLNAKLAVERSKALQEAAVSLSSLPGTRPTGASPAAGKSAPRAPQDATADPKQKADVDLEEHYRNHILAPDADQRFKNLAYTPKAKDNLPAIQAQYNQAVQAEKSLGDIDDTFTKLSGAAEKTGEAGNLRRRFGGELDKLPLGVGHAISGPLRYITDTESNRLYDADQTALLGYVSSALKGTNVGTGAIQEIVSVNSPEAGDSAKVVDRKKQNIKEFIKNHTDTSLLRTWKLSPK